MQPVVMSDAGDQPRSLRTQVWVFRVGSSLPIRRTWATPSVGKVPPHPRRRGWPRPSLEGQDHLLVPSGSARKLFIRPVGVVAHRR